MEAALIKRSMAILVLAAALAGCGHPFIPATALKDARIASAPLSAPVLGVDLYATTGYPMREVTTYGTRTLGYIEHGLDAQSVGIIWDLCSPSRHSNVVKQCAGGLSLTPAAIGTLAKLAKSDHLSVQLRPIIRIGPPNGWNNAKVSWEGFIQPANRTEWFASLLATETPYLRIAKSYHVRQFIVGTELLALGYSLGWVPFLAKAHAVCGCQLSYAANANQYQTDSRNMPPVAALGTDYYPQTTLPTSASQAQVTNAWEASLAGVSESRLEHTSIDEVSIRATAGAYDHSWNWNSPGRPDPQVQVRWFTAICQTVAKYHMRAVYFYMMPLNDDPANPTQYPAYFVKNAGSKAIMGCRKILAAGALR